MVENLKIEFYAYRCTRASGSKLVSNLIPRSKEKVCPESNCSVSFFLVKGTLRSEWGDVLLSWFAKAAYVAYFRQSALLELKACQHLRPPLLGADVPVDRR